MSGWFSPSTPGLRTPGGGTPGGGTPGGGGLTPEQRDRVEANKRKGSHALIPPFIPPIA